MCSSDLMLTALTDVGAGWDSLSPEANRDIGARIWMALADGNLARLDDDQPCRYHVHERNASEGGRCHRDDPARPCRRGEGKRAAKGTARNA